MNLLAIDPGRSTGWASFVDGRLQSCGAGDPRTAPRAWPDVVVIERPQIYRAAGSKGDPNDLITLAIQVGEYKGYFETTSALRDATPVKAVMPSVTVQLVLPRDWKGQVPKPVHHQRIYAKLDPHELSIVDIAGRGLSVKARGDMMDAVGLGLWWLKRTGVGGT